MPTAWAADDDRAGGRGGPCGTQTATVRAAEGDRVGPAAIRRRPAVSRAGAVVRPSLTLAPRSARLAAMRGAAKRERSSKGSRGLASGRSAGCKPRTARATRRPPGRPAVPDRATAGRSGGAPPDTAPFRATPPTEDKATVRALHERVKELNCLYSISKLVDQRRTSLDRILRGAVSIIVDAWQYPEVAAARITVNGADQQSPGYRETPWMQRAPVVTRGAVIGGVTVAYLEPRPAADEGPFLLEERKLLNVVAQRLGEIVEHQQVEQRLTRYREELRSLATQLTRTEERERREIARELHDHIGQTLALAKIKLGVLRETARSCGFADALREVQDLVGRTIADTRTLIFEISPPVLHEFGLGAALEWLAERVQQERGLTVRTEVELGDWAADDELRAALFRAARELLANIVRHARARNAYLVLRRVGSITELRVEDDGVGFDAARAEALAVSGGGFGLFSIRERLEGLGGAMVVDSRPGGGTRVTLSVPGEVPSS